MNQEKKSDKNLSLAKEAARKQLADEFGINEPVGDLVLSVSSLKAAMLAELAGYPFEIAGLMPMDEALSVRGLG